MEINGWIGKWKDEWINESINVEMDTWISKWTDEWNHSLRTSAKLRTMYNKIKHFFKLVIYKKSFS